jgi:hypothetical protein
MVDDCMKQILQSLVGIWSNACSICGSFCLEHGLEFLSLDIGLGKDRSSLLAMSSLKLEIEA